MGKRRLRLVRLTPGVRALRPLLDAYGDRGYGVVTAFSDSALRGVRSLLPEDTELELEPFGSVVQSLLARCGDTPLPQAQAAHTLAAIAEACADLPDDSPFAASGRFAGTHRAMMETLQDLGYWGIDAGRLQDLAEQAAPELRPKLEALASVARTSEDLLRQLGRESHARHLARCIESCFESGAELDRLMVLVDRESAPAKLALLNWLADHGTEVTVVVPGPANPNARLFPWVSDVERAVEATAEPVAESSTFLRQLFTREESIPVSQPRLAITHAPDALAEAEWALRECLDAQAAGLRPDRIAIFCRGLEEYAPLLDAAAKRLGVRLTMPRRAPLLTNAFARLTLAAVEACGSHDVRRLDTIVRSSYLSLAYEARNALLQVLREAYATREGQWQHLESWVESHPTAAPWLASVLKWRREAVEVRAPLAAWLERLRMLMHGLPCLAEGETAGRDMRASTALARALAAQASVERVRERAHLSLPDFARRCREAWEESDVSLPAQEGGVAVVNEAAALPEVDRLLVIGMLEGVFPRRRSEDPILSDQERKAISELAKLERPLPNSYDRARAERDEFYAVCAAPRERLVFSYPVTGDNRDNVPAFYLNEIKRIAGEGLEKREYRLTDLAPAIAKCLNANDRMLREAIEGPRVDPPEVELEDESLRTELASAAFGTVSPRELRDALQCGFRYFIRHRLQLRPQGQSARWNTLTKLPTTTGLLQQDDADMARAALETALDLEIEGLYGEIPEWETALLRVGGRRLIQEWVEREFAARKDWPKEPGSGRARVAFGQEGLRSEVGKGVRLSGTVPAVSKMGSTTVVHLQESRVPISNDGRLELEEHDRLYYGLHLLAAYDPGGATAVEVEASDGKRALMVLPRMPGMVLRRNAAYNLFFVDLGEHDDPMIARREFYEEVKKLMKRAFARIRDVDIRPLRGDHCQWCDVGELCRRSQLYGEDSSPFGVDTA